MANNVFANGLEIACKAGEGVSTAAFPDPCWSPPPPSAGPVIVPYPNTAYASDTANGSKTVFISGKPIMQRDKSYFKSSTGNEPATYAFNKGEKTGVIKGKCYFASWSMNVKVESYNVCRHTDDTTHNHASRPGNTGKWPFTDTRIQGNDCDKELKREGIACGGLEPKEVDKKGKVKKQWFGGNYKEVRGKVKWKTANCVGMNIPPVNLDTDKFTDLEKELNEKLGDFKGVQDAIDGAANQAIDLLQDKIASTVGKGVIKKVLGGAAGLSGIGLILTAAAAADAVADAIKLTGMYNDLKNMNNEAERITNQVKGFKDRMKRILDNVESDAAGTARAANDELADLQRSVAVGNPCLRAKKCQLVSKNTADNGKSDTEGCCKGQTGHHLIPDSYFSGNPCGKSVTNGAAPTVCAEGTTSSEDNGSHGALHKNLDTALKRGKAVSPDGALSYEDAREAAIESHKSTFPFSLCSRDCLRAQLDKHYKENRKCGDGSSLDYSKMPGGLDARPESEF